MHTVCQLLIYRLLHMATSNGSIKCHILYITLDASRAPPRQAHKEILEEELAKDDHAQNMLSVCQRIAMIVRHALNTRDFEEENSRMDVLQVILLGEMVALGFTRQKRNMGIRYTQQFIFLYIGN